MEGTSGRETDAEERAQALVDGAQRVGPGGFSSRPGEHGIEGGVGTLEGHGHTVSGERRDHRVGVADDEAVGEFGRLGESETGDGQRRERDEVIAEHALSSEVRDELADNAKCRQNHDVHRRVAVEPKEVLKQHRVSAELRIKDRKLEGPLEYD